MRTLPAILLALSAVQPLPCQDTPARQRRTRALLAELDAAFNARDPDRYLDHFVPTNAYLHHLLRLRLERQASGPALVRRSTIQDLHRQGSHHVALVRSVAHRPGHDQGPHAERWCYLALTPTDDTLRPILEVEVEPDLLPHVDDHRFTCPACNYRIGTGSEWLVVPQRPTRTQCMEPVSFHLLGADVTLHLSVFLAGSPRPAHPALAEYLRTLTTRDPRLDDHPTIHRWLPPAYAGDPPTGLDGARATTRLTPDRPVEYHLLTLDALRYLMVVDGAAADLRHHRDDLDRLLASFRLLDPDTAPRRVVERARHAHSGRSSFDEHGRFVSEQHRVTFQAPEAWITTLRPTGALFEATLTCPEESGRMWVTAHAPPRGLERWTRTAARRLVERDLARRGLQVQDTGPWQEADERGFARCTLRIAAGTAKQTPSRTLTLALAPDVLVVLDARSSDPRSAALLDATRTSLRRP